MTGVVSEDFVGRGRRLLESCGYTPAWRQEGFTIRTGQARFTVPLAGFGGPDPTDLLDATVILMGDPAGGAAACRALACPFLLLPRDGDLEVLVVNEGNARPIGLVTDVPEQVLRAWLGPTGASRIKAGLAQLPLFDTPVDLLSRAKSRSVDEIGPIIGAALAQTSEAIGAGGDPRSDKRAPLIVVRALAALTIAHREGVSGSPAEIVDLAEREFPSSFDWQLTAEPGDRRLLHDVVASLGTGIDFATLSPSILTEVYETALVDATRRRELAIHYTPPGLASKILDALPVELINPEQRTVHDPTCGSGTLLLAAYDRLAELQPKRWRDADGQADLVARISGRDTDGFAVELAKLALLLHTEVSRNGWDIQHSDVPVGRQPTMIVCNPPWGAERRGWADQMADGFVQACVEQLAPGGALGLVLPKSWLTTRTSSGSRRFLRDRCDVHEVWRLPGNVFADARFPACVLVARRRGGALGRSAPQYRVQREVQAGHTAEFLSGAPARTNVLLPADDSLGAAVPAPPITEETIPVSALATVLSGTQALPESQRLGGEVPFLARWGDVETLESVTAEHPGIVRLNFPSDFAGGRGATLIHLRKVLFPAATRARRPRAAVADAGVAFTNSLRGVAPHDQEDLDLIAGLAVLLSSAYTAACLCRAGHDHNIPASFLPSLRVPANLQAIRDLAAIRSEPPDARDAAVWDAYGTPPDYRDFVAAFLDPPPHHEVAPRDPMEDLTHTGAVAGVGDRGLRIVVDGVTAPSGVWVALPPRLPAAVLAPGADCSIRGVATPSDIGAATFGLHPLSWWDPDTPVPPAPRPAALG